MQLKEHLGWEPEDVDIVIHTHLHYDHAGNDYLFKNAKFIIQRDEFEYGMNCPETGFGFAFNKKRYDQELRYLILTGYCWMEKSRFCQGSFVFLRMDIQLDISQSSLIQRKGLYA